METEKSFLGTNLKHLRELDKLTKRQLANVLSVSSTEIGQLERNEIPKPSFQIVEAIADYFGVDIIELFRSDLSEIGPSLDRLIYRLVKAASSVNEIIALKGLEHTVKGFQQAMVDLNYYSVQRRSISNEQRRHLRAVPKK